MQVGKTGEKLKTATFFVVFRPCPPRFSYPMQLQVTEFRYGIKLAECIRGGDWNCLGGIYDTNWGMADGMHAVVFVDNHDNQRGHGGAGGVMTACGPDHNDWQYKIGAAFLLGHDYGFKRVMSSYYFDNTDQGPPGAQPAPFPNACGN